MEKELVVITSIATFWFLGAICCTMFSLSGIIFLAGVSAALKSNSMYFIMEGVEEPNHTFSEPVSNAMYIYLGTMIISLLFWVRTYTADGIIERPHSESAVR